MGIKDDNGHEITIDRLVGVTWSLLEDAKAAGEVDHAACGKYIELIAKVLLPKAPGASTGSAAAGNLRELLEAARQEEQAKAP